MIFLVPPASITKKDKTLIDILLQYNFCFSHLTKQEIGSFNGTSQKIPV